MLKLKLITLGGNKMTDKDMFERLGKHLFFLTQDADKDVFDRWKEIGLTQDFADYIANYKNKIGA